MSIKAVYDDVPAELDSRTPLPIKIISKCPKCHKDVELNLMEEYLSRLVFNEAITIDFFHEVDSNENIDCFHEWEEKVVFKVGVVQARPAIYLGPEETKYRVEIIKALHKFTKCGIKNARDWVDSPPKSINGELAVHLQRFGANIKWNY